jgi:hypothetical protein
MMTKASEGWNSSGVRCEPGSRVRGLPVFQRERDNAGKAELAASTLPQDASQAERSVPKLSVEALLCTENRGCMKIWEN